MQKVGSVFITMVLGLLFVAAVSAQSTAFTYQGSLNDGANPANGNYDLEFRLFDAVSGGTQQGSTLTANNIAVANGIFSVPLDFGSQFPGAGRFLEIRVRTTGGGAFTLLAPRQPVNSSPYSIKSLNSETANNSTTATSFTGPLAGDVTGTQGAAVIAPSAITTPKIADGNVTNAKVADSTLTGGKIAAGQVVKSVNSLTDSVTLAAGTNVTITPSGNTLTIASTGGGNAILNQTTQQVGANFNISGTGTAGTLDATTQYNLGGNRILAARAFGSFQTHLSLGFGAGNFPNSIGNNSFFGIEAGAATTDGGANSFFGNRAGLSNTTGGGNSFFGLLSGQSSTVGDFNSFFGTSSGNANISGASNSFFGQISGSATSTGGGNSFFGRASGDTNTTGSNNVIIGAFADVAGPNLSNATAIGSQSLVSASNSLILGRIDGQNNATADTNVGIGTTAPSTKLHLSGGGSLASGVGDLLITGTGTFGSAATLEATGTGGRTYSWLSTSSGASAGAGKLTLLDVTGNAFRMAVDSTGDVGIGTTAPGDKLDVNGDIRVGTSGTNGCLKNNNGGTITGTCSSDERFKRGITPFPSVLNSFAKLRPVHYFFRATEFPDKHFGPEQTYGLLAQDVETVLPELVSIDADGFKQIDYGKLPMLTIQAVKELNAKNESQQKQIEELRALVCELKPKANVCRSDKPLK
ncbi:MAG: tail fiber domain-containing protein [Pyrinomonadaceae bacterium]